MTAAPTPAPTTGQALEDYDLAMREAATHPTDRRLLPGLHLGERTPGFLVLTNKEGDLRARQWGASSSVPVTFGLLTEMWRTVIEHEETTEDGQPNGPGIAVVIADRDTLHNLVRMARAETKTSDRQQEAYGVYRALAYRDGLPFSTVFPVLSEALANRYWMPARFSTDSVIDWGEAFDLDSATGSAAWFQALFDRAVDGEVFDTKLMREIVRSEPYGYRAAWYSSSHSQCSAFNQAGKITDAYLALAASDPLLLPRNALTGDLTEIVVTEVETKQVQARIVGEPGKLREDSKVILFSPTSATDRAEVSLQGVHVDGADLVVTLTVSSRSKARAAVVQAFNDSSPLYLTPAPFLAFQRSPANRRWTSDDPGTRAPAFDVPADVAAAAGRTRR